MALIVKRDIIFIGFIICEKKFLKLATSDFLPYPFAMIIYFFLIFSVLSFSASIPLNDNILFAFEKCKTLSVDLNKGLLKEEIVKGFDVHCQKIINTQFDFDCDFFETSSSQKIERIKFLGGSDLGVASLVNESHQRINFLIGKNFASFESDKEKKVCIGIYIFEKEALKK